MKVFVINLKKNHERMALIDSRLRGLGVAYERLEAVYGREISQEEKRMNSSRFWWWCIKGYPMRDGEYGCAMSHLNFYRRMIQDDLQVACVLEDDANPRTCLPDVLQKLETSVDVGRPQVVLLSNHRAENVGGDFSMKRVRTGSFTDGYVITLPAAKKLLEKNYPIKCPSDTWTFWQKRGWLELYQVYPECVNQEWTREGYVSDVTTESDRVVDVRRFGVFGHLTWQVKRFIGLAIARFL